MKQRAKENKELPSSSPLWDSAKSYTDKRGYKVLYVYDSQIKKIHYRMEHIVIYERAHGIIIPHTHCIHHLNGIPGDNRVENLLCIPITMHMRMHKELRRLAQNIAPMFYNVKRHVIINEYVDKARENRERQIRWGISNPYEQRVSP